MNAHKLAIVGVVALVLAGALISPAQAHQRRRVDPVGPVRWVSVRHSHSESEPAAPVVKTEAAPVIKAQAETKEFDPLKGAVDIVAWPFVMLGKTVGAIFGDKQKTESQTD